MQIHTMHGQVRVVSASYGQVRVVSASLAGGVSGPGFWLPALSSCVQAGVQGKRAELVPCAA